MVGPSGKQWLVQTKSAPQLGMMTTAVRAKSGQFGPHMETPVLVFGVPAGATGPRTLISWAPNATPVMVKTAVNDFNVRVPKGAGVPV